MKSLIVLNRQPYDGTDVVWNALRLANALLDERHHVRLFLMNDAVDVARDACQPPVGYDQNLGSDLRALIERGATVKACGSCVARCGLFRNQPYYSGVETSTMSALADWVATSDRILTF